MPPYPRPFSGRSILVLLSALSVVAAGATSVQAYPRPAETERVSTAEDGTEGDSRSIWPVLSADGRYVSFESLSRNLVPGDTNEVTDIFIHDRVTKTLKRISLTASGEQARGASTGPAGLSEDGGVIVFQSAAANLVPDDTNKVGDVYVRDLTTDTLERVSVSSSGAQSTGYSWGTSISADGNAVAFESIGSNLVEGDTNSHWDIFVRDRVRGTTERVSIASDGTQANSVSQYPVLSADARYVAFESRSSNLVPGDTNGTTDIFVHDRDSGATERVSVHSDGTEGNAESTSYARRGIALSGDGRFVAFHSNASNLVPHDTNEQRDVFVHDRLTGETERVSVASDGAEGDGYAGFPWMSADGRLVGFHASSSNLVQGDTNGDEDVFIYDRIAGSTELISAGHSGGSSDFYSRFPSLSANGEQVAFHTAASNMVAGDTNGQLDVFVRDRGPVLGVRELAATSTDDELYVSGKAFFAGAEVSSAADDSEDVTPTERLAGADITGASITFRPEEEDLAIKMDLAALPAHSAATCPPALGMGCFAATPGTSGLGIAYALSFQIEGVEYQVRASRLGAGTTPSLPHFALHRCDGACEEIATLTGGIGTAGVNVRTSVPLALLGGDTPMKLENVRASSHPVDSSGPTGQIDVLALPPAPIDDIQLELGIAPEGSSEESVAFGKVAELVEGLFSGSLPLPGSGTWDLWARACLQGRCVARSLTVQVEGGPIEAIATSLTISVEGNGVNRLLRATLIEAGGSLAPIAGRDIFFFNGEDLIGQAETDLSGTATLSVPPRLRGANQVFEARFLGDDLYLPATARS